MTVTAKLTRAARENGKKGGRPPGSKTIETITREAAIKRFRDNVAQHTDILYFDQLSLARGAQYLFRIDKEWVKTGKGDKGFWRNKKPVKVTSPEEMMEYLTELADNNGDIADDTDESASYYFLAARDPQNNAIESMLDRTYGRAKSELEVNVNLPKPIYSGQSQLPEAKKKIAPKKVESVVIHTNGIKTTQEVQT